jgi:outer membrane protein assembly factor BamB
MAMAASVLALLFKPRELIRACRERPLVALGVLLLLTVPLALIWMWHGSSAAPQRVARRGGGGETRQSPSAAVVTVDWTRVALARIEAMKTSGAAAAPLAELNLPQSGLDTQSDTPLPLPSQAVVFRGGIERLGSSGSGIEGPLKLTWDYFPRWLDDGVEQEDRDAMVLSSPVVSGGHVFGASCTLDPPDSFGAVFCLDAESGRQIWTIDQVDDEPFKGFFSSPAISADGRSLVIGQGLHPDSNCRLLCLDTATGRVRWTVPVPMHIESSPYIEGDMVYVGVGAIENPATHKPIGHPGFVIAVRLSDGQEMWRFDVNDPESSPAMKDGTLIIGSGFNGNGVVALKTTASPGDKPTQLWRASSPYPITGAITIADDLVFAGGGNGDFVFRDPQAAGVVLALQAIDGKTRWSAAMPDAVLGAVAASTRLICPVANGQIVALDRATGKEVWATAISGTAPVLAAAAVTDREVFAVSQNGYLARMELDSGAIIERVYLNASDRPGEQGLCISSPLIVDGQLFVGSETGGLRCYTGDTAP